MQAFSMEESIIKGKVEINNLFEFVTNHAAAFEAYEMEKGILPMVMKIGFIAMEVFFSAKGTGDVGPELKLENGKLVKRQGSLRGKDYFSVFGKLEVPRTYYWSDGESCMMPLDAQANLPHNCYSYLLQEWMDHLSIRDTFEGASNTLEKLLGLKIYTNRIQDMSREASMSYDQYYEQKKMPLPESEGRINVLGFDGKGVPILKNESARLESRLGKGEKLQKKKEAMVGISYTIDPKERSAGEVARNLIYPEEKKEGKEPSDVKAQNIRRMASLERSREEVMHEIVDYGRKRDPENKLPLCVVMDGALDLWKKADMVLCGIEYVGILDIIHVTEYLWDTANAIYGEKSAEGKRWVYDNLQLILKGGVGLSIGGLNRALQEQQNKQNQQESIKATIRYFENHQQWMQYDRYLKMGYPISSGVVESTCGHTVKDRMEGTGRRWGVEGAEAVLLLRSVSTSNDWDAYWKFHMELERSFYYHNTLIALGIADDYNELGISEKEHSSTFGRVAVG